MAWWVDAVYLVSIKEIFLYLLLIANLYVRYCSCIKHANQNFLEKTGSRNLFLGSVVRFFLIFGIFKLTIIELKLFLKSLMINQI